jgi:phage terminase Nu1 subunit (DNA packaging protein)
MNQAQIAAHLDISLRTLREYYAKGLVAKGAPLDEQRGAYIRHLREVAANRKPNGPLDPQQEKARLDQLRADEVADRLAQKRGELIEAHVFERELASAFKTIASALESLPDVLERDAGLDGAGVERVQTVVDRLREELVTRLQS